MDDLEHAPDSSTTPEYVHTDRLVEGEDKWRLTAHKLQAYSPIVVRQPDKEKGSRFECGRFFRKCDRSKRELDKYDKRRNALLEEFGRLDELSRLDKPLPCQDEAATARWETFAINISNLANFVIFAATVFVAALSGSLAIIASALDSLLDMMSGLILWYTSVQMRKPDPLLYPIGKQRMQPVGILVFSAVMGTLGLQVVIIAVEKLITKEKQVDLQGHRGYLVVVIMGVTIVVMFVLAAYCQNFKSKLVKAYADDHFFDALTNVAGLASAILAAKVRWWIDPLGALLLAIYTIVCWTGKVRKNARLLAGRTAPPELLQKITYVTWNHDPSIRQIERVRAYSCGMGHVAEVDVLLPEDTALTKAQEIGQALQTKLEGLADVEQAFVRIASHKPHTTPSPSP